MSVKEGRRIGVSYCEAGRVKGDPRGSTTLAGAHLGPIGLWSYTLHVSLLV